MFPALIWTSSSGRGRLRAGARNTAGPAALFLPFGINGRAPPPAATYRLRRLGATGRGSRTDGPRFVQRRSPWRPAETGCCGPSYCRVCRPAGIRGCRLRTASPSRRARAGDFRARLGARGLGPNCAPRARRGTGARTTNPRPAEGLIACSWPEPAWDGISFQPWTSTGSALLSSPCSGP